VQEASAGECELRFLMVNGESFHLRFPQASTIRDVKQALVDRKPAELIDFIQSSSPGSPPPSKTEELRILHLGKFLEDAKSLQGKVALHPLLPRSSGRSLGHCVHSAAKTRARTLRGRPFRRDCQGAPGGGAQTLGFDAVATRGSVEVATENVSNERVSERGGGRQARSVAVAGCFLASHANRAPRRLIATGR
jgi:Ubiquitin-2 like Rad60 SUMO-like